MSLAAHIRLIYIKFPNGVGGSSMIHKDKRALHLRIILLAGMFHLRIIQRLSVICVSCYFKTKYPRPTHLRAVDGDSCYLRAGLWDAEETVLRQETQIDNRPVCVWLIETLNLIGPVCVSPRLPNLPICVNPKHFNLSFVSEVDSCYLRATGLARLDPQDTLAYQAYPYTSLA